MTGAGIAQIVGYAIVLVALAVPLGAYMARVYSGTASLAQRVLGPIERGLYRLVRVKPDDAMTWKQYAVALLVFNALGILVVYALQRLQGALPGNRSTCRRSIRASRSTRRSASARTRTGRRTAARPR